MPKSDDPFPGRDSVKEVAKAIFAAMAEEKPSKVLAQEIVMKVPGVSPSEVYDGCYRATQLLNLAIWEGVIGPDKSELH